MVQLPLQLGKLVSAIHSSEMHPELELERERSSGKRPVLEQSLVMHQMKALVMDHASVQLEHYSLLVVLGSLAC